MWVERTTAAAAATVEPCERVRLREHVQCKHAILQFDLHGLDRIAACALQRHLAHTHAIIAINCTESLHLLLRRRGRLLHCNCTIGHINGFLFLVGKRTAA